MPRKTCPRCGEAWPRGMIGAQSRFRKRTTICDDCGRNEAADSMGLRLPARWADGWEIPAEDAKRLKERGYTGEA